MYFSIFALALLTIISIFLTKHIYGKLWNICSLMNILWTSITVGSVFGFFDLRKPGERTVNFIFAFLFAYSTAVIIGTIKNRNKKSVLYFDQSVNIDNGFTDILFCLITFSVIPVLKKHIDIFGMYGLKELHEAYLYGVNGTLLIGIYKYWCVYFVLPFFLTIYIYAVYDLIVNNRFSKLMGEAIAGIGMYFIITGGRKVFLLCGIYSLVCIYMRKDKIHIRRKIRTEKKKIAVWLTMFCIVVSLTVAIYYSTNNRLYGGASVGETVCLYMFGGLSLLDLIVYSPYLYGIGTEPLLYGKCTLGMITIPISTLWSFISRSNYQGADYLINMYAEKFYRVSPRSVYNAAVTILYPMIRDFGWGGIIIGGILFGGIVVYVYQKALYSKHSLFWQVIFIQVIYTIVFSVWRYAFLEVTTVMTLIWSWILYRCSKIRVIIRSNGK